MKRKLIAAIGIAGMMVSIAACGGNDDKGSSNSGADAKELTVWLTVDAQNNWPQLVKAADAAVQKAHPGVKIKHEYYGWPDKNTKLDAVLATDKAPDVVEMGNTEMLSYMVKGAFAPVDPAKFTNSSAWLDGLKASVTYDGKTYGVPYYAGGRVANWRKDIAASVGVKAPPTTYTELTADLDKIQKKEGSKFSAWYQPTRDWYAAMSFVYDAAWAPSPPSPAVSGRPASPRPSPSRGSTSGSRSSTSTCTATRPRTSPTVTSSTARARRP